MNVIYKVALFATAAVLVVSCATKSEKKKSVENNAPNMYFLTVEDFIYDDKDAEFDTLSYAVGMNYGLLAQSIYLDAGYDREGFIGAFFEMLDSQSIDYEALRNTAVYVDEFGTTRYRQFMQTKQKNSFLSSINPDAVVVSPILYNEEFCEERVSAEMGRYMAGQVRHMGLPMNRHWIKTAIDDSFLVDSMHNVDSVMRLSQMDFRKYMSASVFNQTRSNLDAKCKKWLGDIAKKSGVSEYRPDENSDAIYYRVDAAGGDVRATKGCDSIYFDYALYNSYGMLLESSEEMVKAYDKYIERVTNDESLSEERRATILEEAMKKREETISGGVIVNNLKHKVLAGCVKEIGEGGKMTIWMPVSYVTMEAMNNAFANDGMVMTINMRRVAPQEEIIVPKPVPGLMTRSGKLPSKNTATRLQNNVE